MKIRIKVLKIWEIAYIVTLFFVFTPPSLYASGFVVGIKWGKYLILITMIAYKLLKKEIPFNEFTILPIVLQGIYILSNVFNGYNVMVAIINALNNLGWFFFVIDMLISNERFTKLKLTTNYFVLLTTLAVILVFLFPNGLYSMGTQYIVREESTTFLGLDNGAVVFYFFALFLSGACYVKKIGKNYIKLVYLLFIVFSIMRKVGTAIVCIAVMSISGLILRNKVWEKGRHKGSLIFVGIFFISFMIFYVKVQRYFSAPLSLLGKDISLGRDLVWKYSIKKIIEHPILGYGYLGGFDYGKVMYGEAFSRAMVDSGNTHNVFLQQLMLGGVVAELIFLFWVHVALKHFDKTSRKKESSIFIVLIFGFLLRSMMEIGSEYWYFLLPFIYYVSSVEKDTFLQTERMHAD